MIAQESYQNVVEQNRFNYKTINKSTRYSVGHQVKEKCCHPSTNLNKYYDNPSNIYSKKAIFSPFPTFL